jgi:hypothetical protein
MRPALLLVPVVPLALVACGGAAHEVMTMKGTVVPASYVRHALVKTAAAPSTHFMLSVKDKTFGCTTTTRSSGDVDNARRFARFDLDNGQSRVILAGPKYYTRSSNSRWQEVDLHRFLGMWAATSPWIQSAPGQLLGPLVSIPRVVKGGGQRIGEVATTKYEAWLRIRHQKRELPVYLWLDRKDYVRQLQLNVFFGVATMRMSRFGEHLHVAVPRSAVTQKGNTGWGSSTGKLVACK